MLIHGAALFCNGWYVFPSTPLPAVISPSNALHCVSGSIEAIEDIPVEDIPVEDIPVEDRSVEVVHP